MQVQGADWVIGQELGRGANANVLAASHPYLPSILLKKGHLDSLEAEAHKMWLTGHPNLASYYGRFSTTEEDPYDHSQLAYIALERLDSSLASMLHWR